MTTPQTQDNTAGALLRDWRRRRKLSQLELAGEAEVSTRHLSFIETGRATASREMLLRLGERLDMPLRIRNQLLLAAGFAPVFGDRSYDAPELALVRSTIDTVLRGHEPFPALAIDRHWTMLTANRAVPVLLEGVAGHLLAPPVNVLRLSLHPEGLAPRIENLSEWRAHLLQRLRTQADATGDPVLVALLEELWSYPGRAGSRRSDPGNPVAVTLRLRAPASRKVLSFISTTTVFGTPTDVLVSEIALECFFPADPDTREALGRLVLHPETAGAPA